jgi:hypothetical protein
MKRETGIGGVFCKTKDAKKLNEWHLKHLGFIQNDDASILFEWRETDAPDKKGYTVWSAFKETTQYFEPSQKDYTINLRVENPEGLLEELKK